mmetsp:Transcript_43426/g.52661  ORF Transcript_43426/g.52661 Transcript_43426/m.52661 type:complete len:90 (+) Transcript_43426:74-343(+)
MEMIPWRYKCWRNLTDTIRRRDGDANVGASAIRFQVMTARRRIRWQYDDGDDIICGGQPREIYEFLDGAFDLQMYPKKISKYVYAYGGE